jgi:hypothetical protein
VEAFFQRAGLRSLERQVHVYHPPFYDFLSRTVTTMHLAFTFDPDISLLIS